MSQIPLQTAFLKFTNKYVRYDYGLASFLFKKLLKLREQQAYQEDAEFEELTLSAQEILEREEERKRNARLLFAPLQFGMMLSETPISIFYASPHNNGHFSSAKIFSRLRNIDKLLKSEFESLNEKHIFVDELEFEKAYNRFFHITPTEVALEPAHQHFVENACQDGRFLAGLELFSNHGRIIFDLIKKYPQDEDYEDDGALSQFLQKTYNLSATEANRNLVRMIKSVRLSGKAKPVSL